ncbi:MAG: amidohydrolase [Haliea sp.]|jgi:predicted amidohydrolase YtcJ|nr:amidohydrolase [Haliea sp.]MDP5064422.1 amidohydrolase [Haliea sp.]
MKAITLSLFAACLACATQFALAAETADTIYRNGTILTINDNAPAAQAVAVSDGRILAVGNEAEVMATRGESTQLVDLEGKTMLPGFVDSHGHAYAIGLQATTANLLPPPDGEGRDIPTLQSLLRNWIANNPDKVQAVGWALGFGYDDSQLKEQRHPTRQELDAISTEMPVVIIHQSGHFGVANSKALELAGVTADSPNPQGGVFRREAGSQQPNGVMEENAFFSVLGQLAASFNGDVNEALVVEGTRLLASFGYTTAQEGRAQGMALDAMERVAERGALAIDLVAYPDILAVKEITPAQVYKNRYRVGGAKLTIDGSPQGKTAWLTQPYHVAPEGQPADYVGYPAIDEATTYAAVEKAYANGWQLLVHSNGDAASDQLISAVRAAQAKYPAVDNRPVLIHGQVLREDQVDALKELGIFPSLFPMHTFYWGDWHRSSVLGPERAENISPTGWLMERGMMFGSHHDAPVALPDSMRVLSATVTRTTRSGRVLGAEHRVPVATALKALTIWPAWQHFEEASKGSIEVGKLADFVVLSENPLTIDPDELASIRILETIKEGQAVYRRADLQSASTAPAPFGIAPQSHVHFTEHSKLGAPLMHGDGCFNPGVDALMRAINGPRL